MDEIQIALVKNISTAKDDFGRRQSYNLYITDRRMVMVRVIDPKYFPYAGGLVGGLINEAVFSIGLSRKKKQEEETKGLTLDEMLDQDKKSFAIFYEDIKHIRLYKEWGWGYTLDIETTKTQKNFQPNKEQFEQLSSVLPNIDAIKGKLTN